jgi:hypothetical protein
MKRRMASSVMLHYVTLVRSDLLEELSASIIRVTRIGELGTTLALTSNRLLYFVYLHSMCRLLVKANVVPSSPILVTMIIEALSSSNSIQFNLFIHSMDPYRKQISWDVELVKNTSYTYN